MKSFHLFVCILAIAMAGNSYAEENFEGLSREEKRAELESMSPEERKAFFEERKQKWQSMSQEEKLQAIEQKRTEKLKRMEEKWDSMSAEEKIRHVEERMKRKRDHMKERRGERQKPPQEATE